MASTEPSDERLTSISDEQARDSLAALIKYVFEHRDGLISGLTYEALAERIGRKNKHDVPFARGMGQVLGRMGHMLQGLEGEWGERIPHLQSLVVLKSGPDRGLPDVGIKEFWSGYEQMSRFEKENKLHAEYQRILGFGSRWNDVLALVGLPPVDAPSQTKDHAIGGAGGESPQHRALKKYVQQNPGLVGAGSDSSCFLEYALPSLDVIDVVFKSKTTCIAVEVKSVVSDKWPDDYERGIYQTIKYRAILKAMAMAGHQEIPGTLRAVLVLQSTLPEKFRQLATDLKVEVLERIGVELGTG